MSGAGALVRVEDVSFRYGGDGQEGALALDGVSLRLDEGEFVGLIGQNGSGKTTLARHLNGLLKPDRGRVLVGERDTREVEPGRLAGQVGYVFQNPDHALFLPTVREEIAYSLGFRDLSPEQREKRAETALDAFNLTGLADRHPASLGRGTRRLVVLAAAYAMEPDLLVLDEPTGGLDHRLTDDLIQTLRAYVASGRSAVLISHDMQLVANTCQRVVVLQDGRLIADGSPGEVFQQRDILSRTGLQQPEIGQLAGELCDQGIPKDTVSIHGFIEHFRRLAGLPKGAERK